MEATTTKKLLKLNLGAGETKIDGFLSVDVDPKVNPDRLWDFNLALPIEDSSCDHIVMYHAIEHIEKSKWRQLFAEIGRVLIEGGEFWLTYPEFSRCYDFWKTNKLGKKDFWEACIFGRGISTWDYHRAILDTPELIDLLSSFGFELISTGPEPSQPQYQFLKMRNTKLRTYEEVLKASIWQQE